MCVLVTPTLERVVKKLHRQQKIALDEAVRTIASQPAIEDTKVSIWLVCRCTSSAWATCSACSLTVSWMRTRSNY